jgi:hypothetical protein
MDCITNHISLWPGGGLIGDFRGRKHETCRALFQRTARIHFFSLLIKTNIYISNQKYVEHEEESAIVEKPSIDERGWREVLIVSGKKHNKAVMQSFLFRGEDSMEKKKFSVCFFGVRRTMRARSLLTSESLETRAPFVALIK